MQNKGLPVRRTHPFQVFLRRVQSQIQKILVIQTEPGEL